MKVLAVKYYRGTLHSQFFIPLVHVAPFRHGEIELEPRYLLRNVVSVTEIEYQDEINKRHSHGAQNYHRRYINRDPASDYVFTPHIFRQGKHLFEWEKEDGEIEALLTEEFLFKMPPTVAERQYEYFDFITEKDHQIHGRVTGQVICKVVEYEIEEQQKIIKEINKTQAVQLKKEKFGIVAPLMNRRGCNPFSSVTSGFFWASHSRSGCFGTGCGLFLPILLLWGLVMWLWKSCNSEDADTARRSVSRDPKDAAKQIVIHDTIVIKEKKQVKEFVDSTVIKNTEAILLPNVQFYSNSANLLPYSIRSIQELADYMNLHPAINAVIKGHTDDVGDAEKNLLLSQQRAETVRQVLVSLGINASRIQAKGYGESMPKTRDQTVEARAINRRVEVELLNTKQTENHRSESVRERK
jgi:outer membrane protein OmpA-like peptidoglycan-associated protein